VQQGKLIGQGNAFAGLDMLYLSMPANLVGFCLSPKANDKRVQWRPGALLDGHHLSLSIAI